MDSSETEGSVVVFLMKQQPIPIPTGRLRAQMLDAIASTFSATVADGIMVVSKGTFTEACLDRGIENSADFVSYQLQGGWRLVWHPTVLSNTVIFGKAAEMQRFLTSLRN